MLRRTLLATAAFLILVPALAAAENQTFTIDPAHSVIAFKVRHLMTKVAGRFDQFEGDIQFDPKAPESMVITGKIAATSIDTNQPNRDKHLRSADFFDVEKCPDITFKSTKVVKAGDSYKVTGDLSMHCVTKPVVLDLTLLGTGPGQGGSTVAGFEAKGKLNRQDWGINWNRTLDQGGTLLSDDVELEFQVQAKTAPTAAK